VRPTVLVRYIDGTLSWFECRDYIPTYIYIYRQAETPKTDRFANSERLLAEFLRSHNRAYNSERKKKMLHRSDELM